MQISEYCRPKGMPLNHTKLGIVVTDYSWQADDTTLWSVLGLLLSRLHILVRRSDVCGYLIQRPVGVSA